ncbi:ABC transporter [Paraphotobacterium marinum]|uniref:ABC transporter n=1 Tax=Paraphotobacterium marinum TaxID=1755811 RepID=A0A220VDT2_9GAMM|nr:VacJ family lipoprotein [Paraphotobacterium marinum]ASK78509.1 ABC transporter [Paraphotobacterium marinum]
MEFKFKLKLAYTFVFVFFLTGCSSTYENKKEQNKVNQNNITESSKNSNESLEESGNNGVNDPLEGFNRVMFDFQFNYLYPIAKPVSLAYVKYTPPPLRFGIKNFLSNLDEPRSMVNSLLRLEVGSFFTHLGRFLINTIFSLGLVDFASKMNLGNQDDEKTFGETLGYWNTPQGPYYYLPILGENTVRNTADYADFLYPLLNLLTFPEVAIRYVFNGMETIAAAAPQDTLLFNSPDPYIFYRDTYLQRDYYKIHGTVMPGEDDSQSNLDLDSFADEVDGIKSSDDNDKKPKTNSSDLAPDDFEDEINSG